MLRVLTLLLLASGVAAQATLVAARDVASSPSPFSGFGIYGRPAGQPPLRQWVFVDVSAASASAATLEVDDGVENVSTPVTLAAGNQTVVAYGRTRFPAGRTNAGVVRLRIGGNVVSTLNNVTLGSHRPWTCHLVSDTCDDDVWGFNTKAEELTASVNLTRAELDAMDRDDAAGRPDHARNRFHSIHARAIEDFVAGAPVHVARMAQRIAQGRLEVNPMPTTPLTAALSGAEFVQHLIPYRRVERAWQPPPLLGFNYQETAGMPFGLPTVLAESGVVGLAFSPLYSAIPTGEVGPLSYWEGPDGQRVLLHVTDTYYVAQGRTWQDLLLFARNVFDNFGPQAYPWSHYCIFGTYSDLFSTTWTRAGVSGQIAYAAWAALQQAHPGAEFPRVDSSTHSRFFGAIAAERTAHPGIDAGLPVLRGDYGSEWEGWTVSLARYASQWREAMALLPGADVLLAAAELAQPGTHAVLGPKLDFAHRETTRMHDHGWCGSDPTNKTMSANLRRDWGRNATRDARDVSRQALQVLTLGMQTGAAPVLVVFHKESFPNSAVAEFDLTAAGLGAGPWVARDRATGQLRPTQVDRIAGSDRLLVECGVLPPFGWRSYELVPGTSGAPRAPLFAGSAGGGQVALANEHHRVVLDPVTHRIVSLLDLARGRELVPSTRPLGLYGDAAAGTAAFTQGTLVTTRTGAVCAEAVLAGSANGIQYTTTVRVHAGRPGIEWETACSGGLGIAKGPLFLAGARTAAPTVYVQNPLAVFRAGYAPQGDQLPRSSLVHHAQDRYLDIAGADAGMTVVASDSMTAFVQGLSSIQSLGTDQVAFPLFGYQWTTLVNEKPFDQNGETEVRFRFALLPHDGVHRPAQAYRFASAVGRHAPLVHLVPANQNGGSGQETRSFAWVPNPGVAVTTLGFAEDGPQRGLVAQVWDMGSGAAQPIPLRLGLEGWGGVASGIRTDPMQRDRSGAANDLSVVGARAGLALRPRSIATARLFPGAAAGAPQPQITGVQPPALASLQDGQVLRLDGPELGAAIAVQVGTQWFHGLRALGADAVEVEVPRIDALGTVPVRVRTAHGLSAAANVTITVPSRPRLWFSTTDALPSQVLTIEQAAQPGDLLALFVSPILAPFRFAPGLLELDIGGPGGQIFALPAVNADAGGKAFASVQNPGLGDSTLHFQTIVGRFVGGGLTLPAPTTNVVSVRLR